MAPDLTLQHVPISRRVSPVIPVARVAGAENERSSVACGQGAVRQTTMKYAISQMVLDVVGDLMS